MMIRHGSWANIKGKFNSLEKRERYVEREYNKHTVTTSHLTMSKRDKVRDKDVAEPVRSIM